MLKIFECHAYDIHGQGFWKFAAMLRVKAKSMLLQLRLHALTSTAIFTVNRRFDDHPRRTLVRSLRNLHDDVAVHCVHTCVLQECTCNMKNLKFAARSWGVGWDDGILWPGKNNS